MSGKARKRVLLAASATAAVCLSLAVVFAVAPAPTDSGSVLLDPRESLSDAEGDGSLVSVASAYEPSSAEKFADVMSIRDGFGNELTLADVPASDYSGFLFEVAADESGAGPALALALEAADAGLVEQVHGNLFSVDSLDTLAGLFEADQLSLVEPDFTMHLIGDVADDDAPTAAATAATAATAVPVVGLTAQGTVDAQGGTTQNPAPDWPPNDQDYLAGMLWNLDMLNVQGAWAAGLDGDAYVYNDKPVRDTPVKVAIIDTGLYGTGPEEPEHEDIDYTRVSPGYNFIAGGEGSLATIGTPDAKGHGTFVAGLIAAKVNNDKGVAGAMPGVTLVPEKVFDTGSAATSDVIGAIYHAADTAKVDVINMSLGGEYNDSALEDACDYAVDKGVLVVASAGNDGVSTPNYPAAYDSVVGVASVNSSKQRSTWSQYGRSVFVTAPGESVTSTYIDGADSYKTGSGTSFSGPEVAALAAMCKSVYPDMDQGTFMQCLVSTSRDLGAAGYDDYYGYGLVDFEAMAAAVLESQVQPWYHLSVNAVDTAGNSIEGATVQIAAAENISWEADETATPPFEAGRLEAGTVVSPEGSADDAGSGSDVWNLHKGAYSYRIVADGYYTATGTFATYAVNQTLTVNLRDGYETTVTVVDSAGEALADAHLALSPASDAARTEVPKKTTPTSRVFDLASGAYAYEASLDGYETARGGFTIQAVAGGKPSLKVALYRAGELSDVTFAFADSDTDESVGGTVGLAVYDENGLLVAPGADKAYRLARGHAYKAVATKVGYESAPVEFTVADEASQVQTIKMTKAQAAISIYPTDESYAVLDSATVRVADSEGTVISADEVTAEGARVFRLQRGSYTYQVSAAGYETREGSFTVSTDSYSLTVALVAVPRIVSFNVTESGTEKAIDSPTVKVSAASSLRALPPLADGTWSLPPGAYRYTVYSPGYEAAQGTFSVAGEDVQVNVALTPRASGTAFAGGTGTADDPYLIETEEQLRFLARQTEVVRVAGGGEGAKRTDLLEGHYKLVGDIYLTGGEWLPIGNEENSSNYARFAGTFDGNGYGVYNVSVNQPGLSYQGFFGSVQGATICNLTVQGSVAGDSYVGGLVGHVQYSHSTQFESLNTAETLIEQCGANMAVTGRYAVGGLVGSAQATNHDDDGQDIEVGKAGGITLRACYSAGPVLGIADGSYDRANAVGGLVGSGQQSVIASCYNAGSVDGGYNVGGLVGNSRRCTVSTSYNSGAVRQYAQGAQRDGTSGGLAGNANNSRYTDCYFLSRDENTYNRQAGQIDSVSIFKNNGDAAAAVSFDDMYRATAFVDRVNTDASSSPAVTTGAFRLGRDFPLLVWQVGADAIVAPAPRVTLQPQGVDAAHAYKAGAPAAELVAEVAPVEDATGASGNALASTLTWAWYESASADGSNATATGATGTGTRATFAPPTDAVGARYYFCVFTNTVSWDLSTDSASTATDVASVFVRSVEDAQAPVIEKLNPSQASDVNTTVSAKAGMDLRLSVTAVVSDGGLLSYQWYRADSVGGAAEPIDEAVSSTYDVDTTQVGEQYFYVVVTNTMQAGNEASTTSDWITADIRPYTVETYEDLASLATAVNNGATFDGLTVYLLEDIEIPAGVSWQPIGSDPDHPFMGTFMGGSGYAGSANEAIQTHRITGLSIDGDALGGEYLGLFGYTSGAAIYDVVVGGRITGASNVRAGLLVGYMNGSSSMSYDAFIENCATLPGSSVEGKYDIGGLVGASGAAITNCANHADVHAHGFTATSADRVLDRSLGRKAVGGVVGFAGSGVVSCSYNTGSVTVDSKDAAGACASYAGGVAGYTGYYSGLHACFNAGTVSVASPAASHYAYSGVLWSGSVAGRVNSMKCSNLHYLENTYVAGGAVSNQGVVDEYGYEYADYHSGAFMASAYFADMMNTGSSGHTTNQFVKSTGGVPHLCWEDDESVAGDARSAEPWLLTVQSEDFPDILSTWSGVYYEGVSTAHPLYVLADSPDGGTLTFRWQKRAVPASAEDDTEGSWQDIPDSGATTTKKYAGSDRAAGSFTAPIDTPGIVQYRCVVRNVAPGVDADAEKAAGNEMESATPAITIDVRSSASVMKLRDPSKENGKTNPWVIDTPEQLKFLADVVDGKEVFNEAGESSFKGQYIELDADIDLSAYADWPCIGDENHSFQGVFDGNGHTVRNMTIAGTVQPSAYKYGLFGSAYGATIRNLEVAGTVLSDTSGRGLWTGGVVGYAYGTFIENVVNRADVWGGSDSVGGIVGKAESCKVLDCENLGTIRVNAATRSAKYNGHGYGGIVGTASTGTAAQGTGAGVFNCFNAGAVVGCLWDGDYCTGAIVGNNDKDRPADVAGCYYLAGSAVSYDGAQTFAGIGVKVKELTPDVAGRTEAVDQLNSPETAWLLSTGGGVSANSGRWGNYSRADLGDAHDHVHLGRGDASKSLYKIDTASAAAVISADFAYAPAGQSVTVSWAAKRGFTLSDVSWVDGAGVAHLLGTGNTSGDAASSAVVFEMPASDVRFDVAYTGDPDTLYDLSSEVVFEGAPAPAAAGAVSLGASQSVADAQVGFTVTVGEGYQVKSVAVEDEYGAPVPAERGVGWTYAFAMPMASVKVSVELELAGSPAAARADSLDVTYGAMHRFSSDASYATDNLLYDTVAFSGSYYGAEKAYMTYELEGGLNAGFYEQVYSFADGSAHRYTGQSAASLIRLLGDADIPASTPVAFEGADGSVLECTYGDLTSLAYNSYDEGGAFIARGLPVLLYFGVDGVPNADGGMGVVFGQASAADDNAAKSVTHVVRVRVGDDVNYSQHVWGVYSNMDAICGGVADGMMGQSKVTVRVYETDDAGGKVLKSERALSVSDIEAMARADRAGVQRGYYSVYLYEDRQSYSDGPYTDYYEGYDLFSVLLAAGVPKTDEGTVQFYQTGLNGLENSWETVDVSMAYLAGNGAGGIGDYSGNYMRYAGEEGAIGPKSGTLHGVRPMIAYGKNGYPLVWGSGSAGRVDTAYNYRGPLTALLPQNDAEGGPYAGHQTSLTCYLGLIDVYLPASAFEEPETPDDPDTPDTPDKPDTPDEPEQPSAPEQPNAPSDAELAHSVLYRTHVQNVGWQGYVKDGDVAGTSGRSLRLEAINISLADHPYAGSIQYRTHVQNIGWQDWVADGAMSGTSGQALRLEAIQIRLTGEMASHYDVYYRVHCQNIGWMGWAKNGAQAGTAGLSYRLEAIQVKLVPKGSAAPDTMSGAFRNATGDLSGVPDSESLVLYRTHVQNDGWQNYMRDGEVSGTTGRALRLEGINLQLGAAAGAGGVRYRTHVQNIGWQDWVSNGTLAGTTGRALRLEAIQVELTGAAAEKYDVYYRVHCQNIGWMGWAKNGAQAGTAGYAYRLEGIQVQLVPKGGAAPGTTADAFRDASAAVLVAGSVSL